LSGFGYKQSFGPIQLVEAISSRGQTKPEGGVGLGVVVVVVVAVVVVMVVVGGSGDWVVIFPRYVDDLG
jgi:hypothetical protein